MKNLFHAGKFLALDMASTIFFLGFYAVTKNVVMAVVLGMALGVGQIAWELARKRPIDAMRWLSLFLVLATGAATFLTRDPRFVMIKPSVIYVIVGVVMLNRGWMNRYLPPEAIELVPDMGVAFGYVWSALMFFSAALNLTLALSLPLPAYAGFMSAWALGSKLGLFLVQYAVMRLVGGRRFRAGMAASDALVMPA
ncbi:MAG TPA: septation protein IspZ [Caulobacteraceae bacterium]|nr:septation protein IspZ [Caulobacteraceae bacterium]